MSGEGVEGGAGGSKDGGRERGWWLDREQWGKRRVRWEVGEGDMGGG